jgi:hypothetical protein
MFSHTRASQSAFNLKQVLELATEEYTQHLELMGNPDDLLPACAFETRETAEAVPQPCFCLGTPAEIIRDSFKAYFTLINLPYVITDNRLIIKAADLEAAQLTGKDAETFLSNLRDELTASRTASIRP